MTAGLVVPFWSADEVESAIPGTIAHLNARKVLAYPTETVYGFGGAVDKDSVQALVDLKGRAPDKPFLILVSGSDMIGRLGLRLGSYAASLAARHWPGPLTLVLPGGERRVPPKLRGKEGGVAVRWTPHKGLQRLIKAYGQPITSTSANKPRVLPATSASEIVAQWREEIVSGKLRVLDGGTLVHSPPSTVVDCTGPVAKIIRAGAVGIEELRKTVPDIIDAPPFFPPAA
jgi:L-threonylcarbamoyladenylate synthase